MSTTLTVRGTDTGTTVLDGAVRDGELGEVVTDHLRLDLDRVEDLGTMISREQQSRYVVSAHLAVVDANDTANHLRDDDHVAQVGLDDSRLLIGGRLLLRLAELLDKTHGAALQTALEPPARASVDELKGSQSATRSITSL